MISSKLVIEADDTNIIIKPPRPLFTVMILHGYGGSKEEMLPLGFSLGLKGIASLIIDLPGHGQAGGIFDFAETVKTIQNGLASGSKPRALVGHSLGARLTSAFDMPAVCISPPNTLLFEGRRSELLKVLRVRRVREATPFAGLRSIFENLEVRHSGNTLILYGGSDLKTVKDFAKCGRKAGMAVGKVKNASHLDIVTAPETFEIVSQWLKKQLVSVKKETRQKNSDRGPK